MPYTPEQNGIIERFFLTLKEECVWQQVFQTFEEARRIIRSWCTSTTTGGHTAPWATEAPSNIGRNNQPRWLDFRGALQQIDGVFRSSLAEKQEGPVLIREEGPFVDLILLQRRN